MSYVPWSLLIKTDKTAEELLTAESSFSTECFVWYSEGKHNYCVHFPSKNSAANAKNILTFCYLVMYEHVVEVQSRQGGLVGAAGPTKCSWSWVRQQAKAGSLILQSLTLTLQDQVQQCFWLLLLTAPTLQQQSRTSGGLLNIIYVLIWE